LNLDVRPTAEHVAQWLNGLDGPTLWPILLDLVAHLDALPRHCLAQVLSPEIAADDAMKRGRR
jgi:hypothetical protein